MSSSSADTLLAFLQSLFDADYEKPTELRVLKRDVWVIWSFKYMGHLP